jgi:hypothetical protein
MGMLQKMNSEKTARDVQKIVVTGGPCAGKTTTINYLRGVFGEAIVTIPEVASVLLSGGYPMPGRDLDHSAEWQSVFQDAVYSVQTSAEKAATLAAQQKTSALVVADRGVLDGAAYFKGGRDEFSERYNLSVPEVFADYAAVIHLESLAVRSMHLYNAMKDNNPSRFQSYEDSLDLEGKVLNAWDGHPNRHLIQEPSLDERLIAVESIIRAVKQ